jgi:IPT/TIG domain
MRQRLSGPRRHAGDTPFRHHVAPGCFTLLTTYALPTAHQSIATPQLPPVARLVTPKANRRILRYEVCVARQTRISSVRPNWSDSRQAKGARMHRALPLLTVLGIGLLLPGCGGPTFRTPPTPHINSISPTSTTAGSPPVLLIVNGSNFAASSVVDWNSSDRATSFKSSTQLTVTITAADLATSGTAGVTVATAGDPLNPVSNTVFFTINP